MLLAPPARWHLPRQRGLTPLLPCLQLSCAIGAHPCSQTPPSLGCIQAPARGMELEHPQAPS